MRRNRRPLLPTNESLQPSLDNDPIQKNKKPEQLSPPLQSSQQTASDQLPTDSQTPQAANETRAEESLNTASGL